jgi:hypothetical protein
MASLPSQGLLQIQAGIGIGFGLATHPRKLVCHNKVVQKEEQCHDDAASNWNQFKINNGDREQPTPKHVYTIEFKKEIKEPNAHPPSARRTCDSPLTNKAVQIPAAFDPQVPVCACFAAGMCQL